MVAITIGSRIGNRMLKDHLKTGQKLCGKDDQSSVVLDKSLYLKLK
jgi:hypothetical protein